MITIAVNIGANSSGLGDVSVNGTTPVKPNSDGSYTIPPVDFTDDHGTFPIIFTPQPERTSGESKVSVTYDSTTLHVSIENDDILYSGGQPVTSSQLTMTGVASTFAISIPANCSIKSKS